jgi:hypothetical protein
MIAAEASTMASWDVAECGDGVQVAAMSWAINVRARKQNWRWKQSSANSSLQPNSLIIGKIQGIFADLASKPGRAFVFGYINQSLAAKLPAHKNRVFFRGIREVPIRYQGSLRTVWECRMSAGRDTPSSFAKVACD